MSDQSSRLFLRTRAPQGFSLRCRRSSNHHGPDSERPSVGRTLKFAYLFLLIIVGGATIRADNVISIAEYRERVGQATLALDSLNAFDEGVSRREQETRITSTLKRVRNIIPPKLIVQWNGAPMEVNNGWLHEALDAYEKQPASDAERAEAKARSGETRARSRERLKQITDRLQALGERLDELLKPKTGAARDKDQEKARMATILRRAEYNQAAQESALARLWNRFWRWFRSLFPEREPVAAGERAPVVTSFAEILVIGLALAVIAYAAWKLLPRFLRNRGPKRKRDKREARVVLGEHLSPDQTSSDILAEAEALARAGNIRAAIRKGYVALLCELGDRKVLRLAQHKTNRDYLRAIEDRGPLHGQMRVLTDSFERHWYGYEPGTPNDWDAFRLHYRQALEKG